jgi:hypothetical protein
VQHGRLVMTVAQPDTGRHHHHANGKSH